VEGALDELKTHQRGAQVVLRSKHPEGVEQEVWAHLLVHYAIRRLMHQAALDEAGTPTGYRLWARYAWCAVICPATRPFPPDQVARATRWAIAEILAERV